MSDFLLPCRRASPSEHLSEGFTHCVFLLWPGPLPEFFLTLSGPLSIIIQRSSERGFLGPRARGHEGPPHIHVSAEQCSGSGARATRGALLDPFWLHSTFALTRCRARLAVIQCSREFAMLVLTFGQLRFMSPDPGRIAEAASGESHFGGRDLARGTRP